MFKKHVAVLNSHVMSGKDVKKLKKDLATAYPALSEDDLKVLFPPKADVNTARLTNKCVTYSVTDGNPLFFDPDGRGESLFPTVYTLWKLPQMVTRIDTYSEVSPKVLSGADLFLQGVIVPAEGLPKLTLGQAVVITIPQNVFPFGVGYMQVDSVSVAKNGLKGKGVKLLHHYPDLLWGLGDKSSPDPSFTLERIFPQVNPVEPGPVAAQDGPASEPQGEVEAAAVAEKEEEAVVESLAALSTSADDDVGADARVAVEAPAAPSANADVDAILEWCLLAGLQSTPDSALPILASDFYSKQMLPHRPAGTSVDIKKSSYKKLSKLLSVFEKKGVITLKLIHKQEHISAVNRQHDLYRAHMQAAAAPAPAAAPATAAAATTSSSGQSNGATCAKITALTYCYKPPSSLKPVFASTPASFPGGLYSQPACRQALLAYAASEDLLAKEGSCVKLDRLLLGHLFNKKEPHMEGDPLAIDELLKRLLAKLSLFHLVQRNTPQGMQEVVRKGEVKAVKIMVEDRQGGRKHLTKLSGLESWVIQADELATQCQRRFQTNCSVTKLPGKNETGKEIALQGDLGAELVAFLGTEFGIAPEFIEVKGKK